jgi:hypothetical protein
MGVRINLLERLHVAVGFRMLRGVDIPPPLERPSTAMMRNRVMGTVRSVDLPPRLETKKKQTLVKCYEIIKTTSFINLKFLKITIIQTNYFTYQPIRVVEMSDLQVAPLVLPPLELQWGTCSPFLPVLHKVSMKGVLPVRVPT